VVSRRRRLEREAQQKELSAIQGESPSPMPVLDTKDIREYLLQPKAAKEFHSWLNRHGKSIPIDDLKSQLQGGAS